MDICHLGYSTFLCRYINCAVLLEVILKISDKINGRHFDTPVYYSAQGILCHSSLLQRRHNTLIIQFNTEYTEHFTLQLTQREKEHFDTLHLYSLHRTL